MPKQGYYQPKSPFVSQQQAAIIEPPRLPRTRFQNRKRRLTAFDAGHIVPFLCDELYPGDHVNYAVHPYIRMSTPLFPLFTNQRVDIHIFAVPMRILWENFKKFQGEQATPTSSIDYTVPTLATVNGGVAVGSIHDHLGLPYIDGQIDPTATWGSVASGCPVAAWWHRAYNKIYNDWYRNQNVQTSLNEHTDDGPDPAGDYVLKRRGKSPDYITTMLPWPQKFEAPYVPRLGNAPVYGIGAFNGGDGTGGPPNAVETGYPTRATQDYTHAKQAWNGGADANDRLYVRVEQTALPGDSSWIPQVYADMSAVTGVSINQLRTAWMVQQLLERNARSGTRYTEITEGIWGVSSPDARQQRPEYIGGGNMDLNITAIAQTAPTTNAPLGALGAAGTAAGRATASYAATEHCVVLGLISIRTELGYQQGLNKMFSRQTRLDYYQPPLAQLGEQAVYRREIYAKGNFAGADEGAVLGYQEAWQDLRTMLSDVTGILRSGAPGTLDMWHLYQEFGTAPTLNSTLVEDNPPMERVLAAAELAENQQYIADIQIDRTITRVLPTYGTPALIGRF